MSKFCKHSRFQYWYHLVYTTLLITPYSLLIRYTKVRVFFVQAMSRPPGPQSWGEGCIFTS
jgi:hypothetical protein